MKRIMDSIKLFLRDNTGNFYSDDCLSEVRIVIESIIAEERRKAVVEFYDVIKDCYTESNKNVKETLSAMGVKEDENEKMLEV